MQTNRYKSNEQWMHRVVTKSDAIGEFIPSLDLAILEIEWFAFAM